MLRRRLHTVACGLIFAGLCLTPSTTLRAQQPTFRTGKVTVSVFATVLDPDGRLVPGLEEADFEVFDNNRLQPLIVFDNKPRPLSIVLMLDTSFSMTGNLSRLRDAAEQFLIRLFPQDEAKVGAFNDAVTVSRNFSSNRDQLIFDMRALDYGNSTLLFDGVDVAIKSFTGEIGRKVVVVFTDGDDYGSKANSGDVIERARDNDVMIYAIGLQSEFFNGQKIQRSKPDSGLRKMAEETGGGYFELTKTSELGPTFTRVAQELHSQYTLGFEAPELDNKVHKLTLKVKKPGLTPRGRRTYVAQRGGQAEGKK